eukprot:TRINITY_DN374_c0_g1_i3.p1 TRINITY_DN374_c0_g1~~TRINITY_DN374_c0_g1_i3.p1  ORF type:complete len:791 (-),score=133.34 TRINITY_DN374_c0_g1_i3:753-3125(-)
MRPPNGPLPPVQPLPSLRQLHVQPQPQPLAQTTSQPQGAPQPRLAPLQSHTQPHSQPQGAPQPQQAATGDTYLPGAVASSPSAHHTPRSANHTDAQPPTDKRDHPMSERSVTRSTHSTNAFSKGGLGSTRTELSFTETTSMHWFTNRFADDVNDLEEQFWRQYYHRYARSIRFWMGLLPLVLIVFYGLFYFAYSDKIDNDASYAIIAVISIIIPTVCAVVLLLKKIDNKKIQYALDLSLLSCLFGIVLVDAYHNQYGDIGGADAGESKTILENQDSYAVVIYMLVIFVGLMNPLFRSSFLHVIFVSTTTAVFFMICSLVMENSANSRRLATFVGLIFASAMFFSYGARESERTQRKNFLFEKDLSKKNTNLKHRLDRLISAKKTAMDLDSPIEKAMEVLRRWRDHTQLNELVGTDVDLLVGILSNPDLFSPDFKKQMKQTDLEVDDDIQKWIMYEFVKSPSTKPATARSVSFGSLIDNARNNHNQLQSYMKQGNHELAEEIISRCEWNAEIFRLNELTGGHPLIFATLTILKKHNLITRFQINEAKLMNFLKEMESGYPDNPFHNRIHAADVTMNMNYILHRPRVVASLTDLDKLACIIAACSHDFRHPGVNNAFHIALDKPEAITYNDRSVLENFHLAQTFQVILNQSKEFDFLEKLSKQDRKELRDTMIEMVLATDMANHFAIMGQFKSQLQSDFNPHERPSKLLMLRVAMKCCDIGHTTKSLELHKNWTQRVSEEFFLQGDKELEIGIPISPFMDRRSEKIHKSQIGKILDHLLLFVCLFLPRISFC